MNQLNDHLLQPIYYQFSQELDKGVEQGYRFVVINSLNLIYLGHQGNVGVVYTLHT
jgi:hypothetical protein